MAAESIGSTRLRAYGTLGNPDFVAAWLCGALPLASALVWFSAARPLGETIRGRFYRPESRWRTRAGVPPMGYGPAPSS